MKKRFILFVLLVMSLTACQTIQKEPQKTILDMYSCNKDPTCMDKVAEEILKEKTAKEALKELDETGKVNNKVLVGCHPLAHAIGRELYRKTKNIGEVFRECDNTCHSGCFHGAMERIFFPSQDHEELQQHLTDEILREKVPKVCDDFSAYSPGNLRFQCTHGVGHAITFFMDYNLTESLSICDLLPTKQDQEGCYGGSFMENVVASEKEKRYLSQDPHFPCNAIEEKYKPSCYLMQTSRMMELGLSYEEILKQCQSLTDYRAVCLQSLGRDMSNDVRQDPKKGRTCLIDNTAERQACMRGILYALDDNSWDGRYSFPYCDNVPSEFRQECYGISVKYLETSLSLPRKKIKQSCSYSLNKESCEANII